MITVDAWIDVWQILASTEMENMIEKYDWHLNSALSEPAENLGSHVKNKVACKENAVIDCFAYFLALVGVQYFVLGAHFKRADVCQHGGLNPTPPVEGLLNYIPPLLAVMEECWQLFKQWITTARSLSSPDSPLMLVWNMERKNQKSNVLSNCT